MEEKEKRDGCDGGKKVPNASKRGRSRFKGIIEVESVVGTRDFYPEDLRLRNWLFGKFREVSSIFCFQEYDAPILESADLYKRKAGEDITKQMYNFEDKDGYEVTLRPEMTPSLARMILKKRKTILFPIKWFTIAQCWRFENIQLGRKREHYQWNMDILGVNSVTCEAEILAAITTFFSRVGLNSKDVGIKLNSRKILQAILEPIGVTEDMFAPVCVIIDKMDKLTPAQVEEELLLIGISTEVIGKINEVALMSGLDEIELLLGSDNEGVNEIKKLWEIAEAYGFADWLVFDPCTIRGLSYYTGIVFEAFDRGKKFRAICGGGRYDNLMELYGSKERISAVGFGMGDIVLTEFLKWKGLAPELLWEVDDVVLPFNESLRAAACGVANKLRSRGRRVEIQLIPNKKISWSYEFASRIGASRLVFVAPDEWQRKVLKVKNLRLSANDPNKEEEVLFEDL